MEIKVSKSTGKIYIVELSGTLDLYSSLQLKDNVMKLVEMKIAHVIIDLNEVDGINSAGIGALIYVFSTLKKIKCPLIIIAQEGPVLQALEQTRIRNYFTIVKSLEDAIILAAAADSVVSRV